MRLNIPLLAQKVEEEATSQGDAGSFQKLKTPPVNHRGHRDLSPATTKNCILPIT